MDWIGDVFALVSYVPSGDYAGTHLALYDLRQPDDPEPIQLYVLDDLINQDTEIWDFTVKLVTKDELLVTWTERSAQPDKDKMFFWKLAGQRFSRQGEALGERVIFLENIRNAGQYFQYQISNTTLGVIWYEQQNAEKPAASHFRIFDLKGHPLQEPSTVPEMTILAEENDNFYCLTPKDVDSQDAPRYVVTRHSAVHP